MKTKEMYEATDNRSVLKKAHKLLLTKKEKICNYCPYHRGENADRKKKDKRNWKRYRKMQWKHHG